MDIGDDQLVQLLKILINLYARQLAIQNLLRKSGVSREKIRQAVQMEKSRVPELFHLSSLVALLEEDELIDRIETLPVEEAQAWKDAHEEDTSTGVDQTLRDILDFDAVMRVARPIMNKHPKMVIGEAMAVVHQKEHKTLAEAEALDAFERIKDKPSNSGKGKPI